jgi:hypothetical protein
VQHSHEAVRDSSLRPRESAPLTIQRCFLRCAFGVMEAVVWCETLARSSIEASICYPVRRFPKSHPDSPAVGRHLAGKARFSGVCMRVLCVAVCSGVFVRCPISASTTTVSHY